MARAVLEAATHVAGKEALAMESFARSLLAIPTIIADNAGYDSAQLVSELKAAHAEGRSTTGLNMDEGEMQDDFYFIGRIYEFFFLLSAWYKSLQSKKTIVMFLLDYSQISLLNIVFEHPTA